MRKTATVLAAVAVSTVLAGGTGGCQGDLSSQAPEDYVGSVVDEIRTQAAEELKKALANEVGDFFRSGSLAQSLGISSGEQEQIESSIRSYISGYSMDEEKLGEVKESLETLLGNAQGLSAEELQGRITAIFEN